jgi:hypothetical protein
VDENDLRKAGGVRVVVANQPAVYREVISAAFERLRPRAEIFTTDPEGLDRECERLRPQFVVCSRLTETVERMVPAWVELYPEHGPLSGISVRGRRSVLDRIGLADLLSILDEAESLSGAP